MTNEVESVLICGGFYFYYNMKKRVGEIHTILNGYTAIITEYFGANNCTILIDGITVRKNVRYGNIKRGLVSNPTHPTVWGYGVIGDGENISKHEGKKSKPYNTWSHMLERCYSDEYKSKRTTYKDCVCSDEWLYYPNFLKWHNDNYIDGYHLDKDILIKGNKIYSAESCCYVPREINAFFIKGESKRGKLPIGVYYNKVIKRYISCLSVGGKTKSVGSSKTIEEAFIKYKHYKEKIVKDIAERHKGKISEKVYEALIKFTININD